MNFPTKAELQEISEKYLNHKTEQDLKYLREFALDQANQGRCSMYVSTLPDCKHTKEFQARMHRCFPELEKSGLVIDTRPHRRDFVNFTAYLISWG